MSDTREHMREQARQAYADGLPSLLPDDNPYKPLVEAHRWGQHRPGQEMPGYCPAC